MLVVGLHLNLVPNLLQGLAEIPEADQKVFEECFKVTDEEKAARLKRPAPEEATTPPQAKKRKGKQAPKKGVKAEDEDTDEEDDIKEEIKEEVKEEDDEDEEDENGDAENGVKEEEDEEGEEV